MLCHIMYDLSYRQNSKKFLFNKREYYLFIFTLFAIKQICKKKYRLYRKRKFIKIKFL